VVVFLLEVGGLTEVSVPVVGCSVGVMIVSGVVLYCVAVLSTGPVVPTDSVGVLFGL